MGLGLGELQQYAVSGAGVCEGSANHSLMLAHLQRLEDLPRSMVPADAQSLHQGDDGQRFVEMHFGRGSSEARWGGRVTLRLLAS